MAIERVSFKSPSEQSAKIFYKYMTVDELGQKELQLYSRVISIHGTMEEKYEEIEKQNIFNEYKNIHQEYANLSKSDIEGLKRGLFLIWLSRLEQGCNTGIHLLDPDAEKKNYSYA